MVSLAHCRNKKGSGKGGARGRQIEAEEEAGHRSDFRERPEDQCLMSKTKLK